MASRARAARIAPVAAGKGNFGKDLFGVQLEITEKLLAAEEKKLKVLKAEIQASKKHSDTREDAAKARQLELHENNYMRIKMQYQRLAQEMQDAAVAGLIQKRPRIKASRSLPAIVMKPAPKPRPSVFDSLVPKLSDIQDEGSLPATSLSPSHTPTSGLLTHGQHSDDLEYRDGLLVAGSLDALIELLIPTESHYPEKTYSYAFILCSRLFIRPYELLAKVSRTFHMRLKQLTTSGRSPIEDYAPYVIELIREWSEMFPYDFRDERMMRSLKEMTQTCAGLSPDLRKSVGQIQSTLVKKLSILDKYEHVLAQVNAVAMERLIDPKTQVNILDVCADPTVMAQQLTHIELERLNNIGPEEFIQSFVKYPPETEPLYRDMKKTSNLEAYVEWFNRLSYLVATEICVADKKRNRAKLIEFFADTAMECKKLNNYNSFMAISAGLFMSPVTRLKKTKAKVSSSKLHAIEEFVDPVQNFSCYRQSLERSIGQASGGKEAKQWVVPFFSLILKDIYFLHEGMSDRDTKGYVRFEKCISLARLVSQILAYKETTLPFPRKRDVLNYLMTIPVHTDDELQLASMEIEPPENSGEKKRYQELKLLLGSYGGRVHRPSSIGSSSSSSPPLSPAYSPIPEES